MAALRQSTSRFATILLLIALALVPVVTSGHRYVHSGTEAAGCGTCTVAFHCSAVATSVPPAPALRVLVEHVAPRLIQVASLAPAPRRAGRAPPAPRALLA
ncbi:MAG TPA: hypothetical protein VLV16_03440 [Gemmatimonadales bacterium]|nr:hypothetical protein [Gemmatimonadales bacterium]